MSKTLQQQIDELIAKDNLEKEVESKLPGFKHNAFFHNYKGKGTTISVMVDLKKVLPVKIEGKIQEILKAYPTTRNNKRPSSSLTEEEQTASPFLLYFKNDIHDCKCQLGYISGDTNVTIYIPVEFYSKAIERGQRKVYDTEYHYFGNQTVGSIRLAAYKLRYGHKFIEIGWYGGDYSYHIEKESLKEEFETLLLKGSF